MVLQLVRKSVLNNGWPTRLYALIMRKELESLGLLTALQVRAL